MPVVRRTLNAVHDLDEIVDYISEDNLVAAFTWLGQIESLFESLAMQPELGQRTTTRRFKDTRRHGSGNYVVYYRPIANGIEILRVLHGARDLGRLL